MTIPAPRTENTAITRLTMKNSTLTILEVRGWAGVLLGLELGSIRMMSGDLRQINICLPSC